MDFSVKSFEVGPVAANCYILKDNDSNEGMVIDPGGNPDKILSAIKEMGVEV
ncbi:MAG TPA: MBL fold metallo-hydrolase, partial [Anaerovibrio sp.]|nr:MBL fold metallo-hydrolase [Anaerovibrio sp.]